MSHSIGIIFSSSDLDSLAEPDFSYEGYVARMAAQGLDEDGLPLVPECQDEVQSFELVEDGMEVIATNTVTKHRYTVSRFFCKNVLPDLTRYYLYHGEYCTTLIDRVDVKNYLKRI
jgi:hypothetical protein